MELSGTKKKIFTAAIGLFAEKGFSATTIRDICRRAGGSNLNAVNYYFGGKTALYNAILEMVAVEGGRRLESAAEQMDHLDAPEEKLRLFIFGYMRMLYDGGELGEQLCRIYIRELADPSAFFLQLVDRHTIPQSRAVLEIFGELLGPDVPASLARDCLALLIGQVTYYAFFWPVFTRVYPEHPPMDTAWKELVENIFVFSLAGIRALREKELGT